MDRQLDVEKLEAACKQVPGADPLSMIEALIRERKRDEEILERLRNRLG
jgi:hypothetical protein